MVATADGPTSRPRLRITVLSCDGRRPSWRVRWRLSNEGERPIRILTAVQPHARFRNEERPLDVALGIGSGTEVVLPVTFDEPAGAVVENPFLILRVSDAGGEWRVLARLRVVAADRGEPSVKTEAITTQRIGLPEQPEGGAI